MSASIIVLISLLAIIVVGGITWISIEIYRKSKEENVEVATSIQQEVIEEPTVAPVAEVKPVEEKVDEPTTEEAKPIEEKVDEVIAEEVTEEPLTETGENVAISDLSGLNIKRVPFSTKMLSADDNNKLYYQTINDKFLSLRKVNPRVSTACVSYRHGRYLIAKLTLRGKTLKLHLSLPLDVVDEKIYFQKNEGDVKAYAEVPFTVKVKSNRGLKYALELIDLCARNHNIEAKNRFSSYDVIENLENKVEEQSLKD